MGVLHGWTCWSMNNLSADDEEGKFLSLEGENGHDDKAENAKLPQISFNDFVEKAKTSNKSQWLKTFPAQISNIDFSSWEALENNLKRIKVHDTHQVMMLIFDTRLLLKGIPLPAAESSITTWKYFYDSCFVLLCNRGSRSENIHLLILSRNCHGRLWAPFHISESDAEYFMRSSLPLPSWIWFLGFQEIPTWDYDFWEFCPLRKFFKLKWVERNLGFDSQIFLFLYQKFHFPLCSH